METFLDKEHGFAVFTVAFAINIVVSVGKLLWDQLKEKSSKTDEKQSKFDAQLKTLSEKMARLEGSMDHLQSVISSYMETTIEFASKLGAAERRLENVVEQLQELSR